MSSGEAVRTVLEAGLADSEDLTWMDRIYRMLVKGVAALVDSRFRRLKK